MTFRGSFACLTMLLSSRSRLFTRGTYAFGGTRQIFSYRVKNFCLAYSALNLFPCVAVVLGSSVDRCVLCVFFVCACARVLAGVSNHPCGKLLVWAAGGCSHEPAGRLKQGGKPRMGIPGTLLTLLGTALSVPSTIYRVPSFGVLYRIPNGWELLVTVVNPSWVAFAPVSGNVHHPCA